MKRNIIQEKSFAFALKIVSVCKQLMKEKEFLLSKQLLKSGTSIAANIEEAIGAQSKTDFLSKLAIAYKEARETSYWIKLLKMSGYLIEQTANALIEDVNEICRIIGSIQLTTKSKYL